MVELDYRFRGGSVALFIRYRDGKNTVLYFGNFESACYYANHRIDYDMVKSYDIYSLCQSCVITPIV